MASGEGSAYFEMIRGMADAMERARAIAPNGAEFERFEDLLVGPSGVPKVSLYYSLSRGCLLALPFGSEQTSDRIVAPFNVDLRAAGNVREACREHVRLTGGLVRHEALPNFVSRAKAFSGRRAGLAPGV